MQIENTINEVIINKNGKEGIIISVDNYIHASFDGREATFQLFAFIDGYLKYKNESLQNAVNQLIKKYEIEQKQIEDEKRLLEMARREQLKKEKALLDKQKPAKRKKSQK